MKYSSAKLKKKQKETFLHATYGFTGEVPATGHQRCFVVMKRD